MNIDDLTQEERRSLLGELLKHSVGAVPVDFPPYQWALAVRSSEVILPGCQQTIMAFPMIAGRPKKFIVDNVDTYEREIVEHFEDVTTTTGRWWWKKSKTSRELLSRYGRNFVYTLPRNAWAVTDVFIGNRLIFPSFGNISGSMFSPEGTLGFGDLICHQGIGIAVCVKNTSHVAAKFSGTILGTYATEAEIKADAA